MRRAPVNFLLRLGVSLAAIWLAWRLVGGHAALEGLGAPVPGWLVLTALCQIAILGLLAVRLGIVMRARGEPASGFGWRFRLTWAGFGLSQVAFGAIGGDGYRLYRLGRRAKDWRAPAVIVLADRMIGLIGLAIVGCLGLLMITSELSSFAVLVAAWFGLIGAAGLLLSYLAARRARAGPKSARSAPPPFWTTALALPWRLASTPLGWAALGLAVAGHLLSVVMFYAVGRGFGFLPPFPETLVAVPAGLFAAILPVSLGGWGAREVAVSSAFVAQGSAFAQSVTVSILFGLACVALGLPGMVYAWRDLNAFGPDG